MRGTIGIRIEKHVNGVDADTAPGAQLPVGSPVVWTYTVHNESGLALGSVTVTDDGGPDASFTPVFVGGDANGNGLLDPGEVWTYTSVGVRAATAIAGHYVNVATVTALTLAGGIVTDDDEAHYTGIGAQLVVEKAVNAVDPANPDLLEDADDAPGPRLAVGSTVTFTYRVFSTGASPVTGVVLVDDNGTAGTGDDFSPTYYAGDANGNGILDPGEVWLYRAIRTAAEGQYTNIATVTGLAQNQQLTDTDPANYFGVIARILIEKAVNAVDPFAPTAAEDADTQASARLLAAGTPVVWTYLVRTLTATALRAVVVTDDNGTPADASDDFTAVYVSGDTDGDGELDPNEVWLFTSAGVRTYTAGAGFYGNRGTVTARDPLDAVVSDDDAAFHFGVVVGIDVEKSVNGQDADTAPGVFVAVGSTLTWTYTVTNTGNAAISVELRDDGGTPGIPADDFVPVFTGGDANGNGLLDVGETWTYTASGLAPAGSYANLALAIGRFSATGQEGRDTDAAHAFAVPVTGLRIEKSVNAADPANPTAAERADAAPGRELSVGAALTWTYQLFNDGAAAIDVFGVTDDRGTPDNADDDFLAIPVLDADDFNVGDVDQDGLLDPGEVWLFTSAGVVFDVVAPGLYGNRAVVSGVIAGMHDELFAVDDAFHTGTAAAVRVVKLANGQDANTVADAVLVAAGSTVAWTFVVTLVEGAGSLSGVTVVDDLGTPASTADDIAAAYVSGDADGNGRLDPGETWIFRFTSIAAAGSLANRAVVTARDAAGGIHTDDDVAHIFGVAPRVIVEKAVNAVDPWAPSGLEDADAVGNEYLPGTPVVWTYLVTNTGNYAIAITSLVDDHGTPGVASDDFTPIYVGGDANGNGLLDVGETWLYTSVGALTHVVGTAGYANTAKVTAFESRTSQTVTDDDIAVYRVAARAEGHTPGFWKNNATNWGAAAWPTNPDGSLVYSPTQTLGSVFSAVPPAYAGMTLLEALGNGGGGIDALLRQAVAALLSAAQPFIAYPYAANQVVALTNAAIIAGGARIDAQKNEFDRFNNYGADIDQHGNGPTIPVSPPPTAPIVIPSLAVSDATVTEGRNGTTTATVTITLSSASTSAVTVTIGITGGTATSGTDYTGGTTIVLTFAAGQTTATFSITVRGDRTVEADETVLVGLWAVSAGATIADAQGVITIRNDDG